VGTPARRAASRGPALVSGRPRLTARFSSSASTFRPRTTRPTTRAAPTGSSAVSIRLTEIVGTSSILADVLRHGARRACRLRLRVGVAADRGYAGSDGSPSIGVRTTDVRCFRAARLVSTTLLDRARNKPDQVAEGEGCGDHLRCGPRSRYRPFRQLSESTRPSAPRAYAFGCARNFNPIECPRARPLLGSAVKDRRSRRAPSARAMPLRRRSCALRSPDA
jgi:hypothetical protein